MLATSEEILSAWLSPARQLAVRVQVDQSSYGSEDVTSLSFDSGSISGEVYQIGSTYMNTVQIVFPSIIETIKEDQEVIPELGILVDGEYHYSKLGHFFITEFNRDRNAKTTTITASDKMIYMEGVYESKLTYSKPYREVALEIANLAGVEINQASFASLGILAIKKPVGYTYRQAIGLIAQFEGGFASFNRDGELEIRRLRPTDFEVTPESYLLKGFSKNENAYRIGGVTVRTGEEETDVLRVGSTNGSQIELENKVMTQTLLNNIWDLVKNLNYFPFELKWRGCPLLEAGDWMYVADRDGKRYSVPNLSYSLNFNGGLSGDSKATTNSSSQATYKYRGTLKQRVDWLDSILSANNWNSNYYDATEPPNPKEGDIWFKPNGQDTEIWIYEKDAEGNFSWVFKISTAADPALVAAIEDNKKKVEEAQKAAEDAQKAGDDAQVAADQAKEIGEAAQSKADSAIVDAATALNNANNAVNSATDAAAKADQSVAAANQAKSDAANALENANQALSTAQQTADDLLALDFGAGNLLRNSTWNYGRDGWVNDFQEGAYLTEPESDKPNSHVLNLVSIVGGTRQFPSDPIWVNSGEIYILEYDCVLPIWSTTRNDVLMCVRIFESKTGSLSAANSLWSPYHRRDDAGATIEDIGKWKRYSWKFIIPEGKSGWLRVIPYWGSNDGVSIAKYRELMFTHGNVSMAWEPSQEDIQVQIDNVNGELSQKVSQTTFNQLENTVSQQSTQIIQNKNDIALKANQTTVDSLSGRVTTAEGSISTIAGQVALKANKTDVDALTGRVSSAESQLTVQSGKITALNTLTNGHTTQIGSLQSSYEGLNSTVSKVQTDVDGMEYTNPNLLIDSDVSSLTKVNAPYDRYFSDAGNTAITALDFKKVSDSQTPSGWVIEATGDGTGNSTTNRGLCWYQGGRVMLEIGKTYTMSCYARLISGASTLRFQYGISPYFAGRVKVDSDEWKQYSWTFTAQQDSTRIYMPAGSGEKGTAQMNRFKLEEGNRATPWNLSYAELATVTQLSSLTQTVDSIQLSVADKASQSQVIQLSDQITSVITELSTTKENLIRNADFKEGTNYFDITGADSYSITKNNGAQPFTSDYLRITRLDTNSASSSWLTQISNASSSHDIYAYSRIARKKWMFSGWYYIQKTVVGSIKMYCRVTLADGTFKYFNNSVSYPHTNNAWTKFSFPLDLSQVNGITDFRFSVSMVDAKGGNIYFAELQLEAGEKATAFTTNRQDNASQSQITQLSDLINLRVQKGDVINQINISTEEILIAGNKVRITGQTTIDNAVIKTANIADLAVNTAKIANLAVSEAKIGNLAVSSAKIADAAITSAKIGTAAIGTAHIGDGVITTAKIGSLSADKITTGTLNAANVNLININAGSITTGILKGITIQAVDFKGENMTLTGAINLDYTYNESSGVDPRRFNGTWTIQNNYIWMRGTETGVSDSALTGYFETYIGGDVLKFRRYTNSTSGVLKSRVDVHSSRLTITGTWNADDGFWAGPNGYANFNNLAINGQHGIISKDGVDLGFYRSNQSTTIGLYAKDFVKQSQLSTKTNISELDQQEALETLLSTDILLYQYKSDVGTDEYHASVIIDDIHDAPIYRTPYIFTGADMRGRDDGTVVGYLVQAVKALHQKIKVLEEKVA